MPPIFNPATRDFLGRSMSEISKQYGPLLRAAVSPWKDHLPDDQGRTPLVMAKMHSEEDIQQYVTGCDADIGGFSSVNLSLDDESRGRFWGNLDATVPNAKLGGERIAQSGYAGFRSKIQRTILGRRMWDTSYHRFIKARVRVNVHTRSAYYVNLSTDEWDPPKLWQHRLWLHPTYNWQEVIMPIDDFTFTVAGSLGKHPQGIRRDEVTTIGMSVLGPREGPFDLSIDSIEAVNIVNEVQHEPPANERLRRLLVGEEEEHEPVLAAEEATRRLPR